MNTHGKRGQSLSETHPNIAADWDRERNATATPFEVDAWSKRKAWWKCSSGHVYEVSVHTRVRTGGCKICNQPRHTDKIRRIKLSKGRSFGQGRPDLLSQWNYERNDLGPFDVSEKSHKAIWWRCEKSHEWQSTPQRRARGDGCPVCARASAGSRVRAWRLRKAGRSLADASPNLLAEWDYDNNVLAPTDLAPKSNFRAHWKCRFGHKWEATVVNRVHNLSGCPFCTNQTSRLEIFILCELRSMFRTVDWRRKFDGTECDIYVPEKSVAIEIDGEYWHKSKIKADQRKTAFFEAQGITLFRVRDSRLPAIPGNTVPFAPSQPAIAVCVTLVAEIHSKYPDDVLRQYLAAGVQRNERDFREMIARLPAPPKGETLADLYPDVAAEWDYEANLPLMPELFSPGSDQKVGWRCALGHKWLATIKNRAKNGSDCPECYRQAPHRTRQRLAAKIGTLQDAAKPFLTMWDYAKNKEISPSDLPFTSRHRVWWQCPQGHGFLRSPDQMENNSACPQCSSLAERFPEIAAQWDIEHNGGKPPERILPGSGKKVWWRCPNGHRWQARVFERTHGTGCPQCFEERRSLTPHLVAARREGKSLLEVNPPCLSEWDYALNAEVTPDHIRVGSKAKCWWRCPTGHPYQQAVATKVRGYECPVCASIHRAENIRKSKLARTGSLKDNFPEIASEWHPTMNGTLSPTDVSSNSHRLVWWHCPNGHDWKQSPNYRVTLRRRGSAFNCPMCGSGGRKSSWRVK
ncbi:MAG: hypothetical protein HP496_09015 [Nitrospira sp.]|nr:hypothetical protein [Nitrospira sp.]